MGRPKGLLVVRGRPLLTHHVLGLLAACDEVVVVLGAQASAHREAIPRGVRIVVNARWAHTWPADSLALALDRAPGAALVTPVDVPPAEPETLAALLAAGAPAVPVGPDGRPGHPVLLGGGEIAAVQRGALPEGLRTVLGGAQRVPVSDALVGVDFDDPAAWDRVRPLLEGGGG